MKFDLISLGDHLANPVTGEFNETQSARHKFWTDYGIFAEKVGFDAFWLGEHHASQYILSSPQMLLAAIAVQTSRITLGTAVSLLPNIDPVRTAEDFATLDVLSEGRAEIGFGSGITPHTFDLFGQNIEDGVAISQENLELLTRLWNEKDVCWQGKFRTPISDTTLQPRTFSGAAIPINRAVGSSIETARHAGRSGHKLMLFTVLGGYAKQRELADAYREAYVDAGHDRAGMSVSAVAYMYVSHDPDAFEFWTPYVYNYLAYTKKLAEEKGFSKSNEEIIKRFGKEGILKGSVEFCGTPAEIADKIMAANEDAGGIDRFQCLIDLGGLPGQTVLETAELFITEAVPKVREALSVAG